MEQKWEQGRDALAIPRYILGAALGADCLAARELMRLVAGKGAGTYLRGLEFRGCHDLT